MDLEGRQKEICQEFERRVQGRYGLRVGDCVCSYYPIEIKVWLGFELLESIDSSPFSTEDDCYELVFHSLNLKSGKTFKDEIYFDRKYVVFEDLSDEKEVFRLIDEYEGIVFGYMDKYMRLV